MMDNLDELIVCLENGVDFHTKEGELLDLFKELKQLRIALDMACEELGEFCCSRTKFKHKCDYDCVKHWKEYLLQKAGEENDT